MTVDQITALNTAAAAVTTAANTLDTDVGAQGKTAAALAAATAADQAAQATVATDQGNLQSAVDAFVGAAAAAGLKINVPAAA